MYALMMIGMAVLTSPSAGSLSPSTIASPAKLVSQCAGKEGYDDPAPAARIYGNTYYVGTCGISSILIVGRAGDILIDGGTRNSAPLILSNLRTLGIAPSRVKIILNSHEHFDHVGGIAELRHVTGARVIARAAAKDALEAGMPGPGDPQRDLHQGFPPVRVDTPLSPDGHVRLGDLDIKALPTPGHTQGSTSWSWRSCEGGRCVNMVYADSLTAVSADNYRFSDHLREVEQFRSSIDLVKAEPCGILMTPHPGASALFDRLAGKGALIDGDLCATYALRARKALEKRLKDEHAH